MGHQARLRRTRKGLREQINQGAITVDEAVEAYRGSKKPGVRITWDSPPFQKPGDIIGTFE